MKLHIDILNKQNIFFFSKTGGWETVPVWGSVSVERGGCKERMYEGEYGGNNMYSCMKMEKRDLLQLFW
jgi:hypothetical protein